MALRLKPDEDVSDGARRIVRGEIARALRLVTDGARGGSAQRQHEAVHDARKSLKRARAVLRLLRDALGESRYHRENFALRDAARPLTAVRDAKVFVDAFLALERSDADATALARVERQLVANQRAVAKRVLGEEGAFGVVATRLAGALQRMEGWNIASDGWSTLEGGLKRAYGRSRHAYGAARERPTSRKLHEWRKQTKYLLYQLQILEPAWSDFEKELAGRFDHLADLLGDDHDLAELRRVVEEPEARRLFDERRAALEREAFALGRTLFGPRPGKVIRRIHGAWLRWHA